MFFSILARVKAVFSSIREERAARKRTEALITQQITKRESRAFLEDWKSVDSYLVAHVQVGGWLDWGKRQELWFLHMTPAGLCACITREVVEGDFEIWHVEEKDPFLKITLHGLIESLWPNSWRRIVFDTRNNQVASNSKTTERF